MAELICFSCENIIRDDNNDINNIFKTNCKDVFSIFSKYTIKHDNRSWFIDFLVSDTFISNFYPDVEYLIRIKNLNLNDALLTVIWVATKREWNLLTAKSIKNQLNILDETLMKLSLKNRPENTYNFDRIYDIEDYLNYLLTIINDYRSTNFDNYIVQCTEEWTNRFKIIKSSILGTYETIINLLPNTKYVKIYDFYQANYILKLYKINPLFENFKINYQPNSLYDIMIKECIYKINLDRLIGTIPNSVILTLKDREDIEKFIK
jgi:hypothetical protein